MLTEVKNNYKSILKYFDFDESISSTDYRKQKLIEIANSRTNNRPKFKTKLGMFLSYYTNKNHHSYCPSFDKTIRKLRPDWFLSRIQIANKKKQDLISMAKNGENRPGQKTKLGAVLCSYTNKSHGSYCPKFDKTIRKLRPDWFVLQTQIADQVRQKLIKMAKNGEPRPNQNTKLGRDLCNYLSKSSFCYCPIFDKNIRKLAPAWFVSKTQIANKKKQELIRIAKNGKPRPNQKTKLGMALSSYTCKSCCYCPIFDKIIRKLRPDWFKKCSLK
jgi:hypothetical protein